MKQVAERSVERALARSREAAGRSLDKATRDAYIGILTEPFLTRQSTCATNMMSTNSNTSVLAMGTTTPRPQVS